MAGDDALKSGKRVLQDRVWESLSELCQKMDKLEDKPFRLGGSGGGGGGTPGASSTSSSSSPFSVDISTSFLRTEQDYDWFDLDQDGKIIVQPKIPIFPEDFPPGQFLHPLSWWGIVEPITGERKNPKIILPSGEEMEIDKTKKETLPPSSTTNETPAKRGRSNDQQQQQNSQKKSNKKRSKSRSRDRKEDTSRSGHRDRNRRSPDSLEQRNRFRNGPPPPHTVPQVRRGGGGLDSSSGPPPPPDDRRRVVDRRHSGPPGGDRMAYSEDMFPPLQQDSTRGQRHPRPEDRGRYDGGRHHDEFPRRDDRGRNDAGPRYPNSRRGHRSDDF